MNQDLIEYAFKGEDFSKPYTLTEAAMFFYGKNVLHVGELAERAISNKTGLKQHSRNKEGSDLEDGSEIKYSNVCYGKSSAYATFAGTKNKTGTIRGWVYEGKNKKNYYFLIPYEIYSKYSRDKDSNPKVYFDKNTGKPRTPVFNTNPNLWECKVTKRQFFSFKQK